MNHRSGLPRKWESRKILQALKGKTLKALGEPSKTEKLLSMELLNCLINQDKTDFKMDIEKDLHKEGRIIELSTGLNGLACLTKFVTFQNFIECNEMLKIMRSPSDRKFERTSVVGRTR